MGISCLSELLLIYFLIHSFQWNIFKFEICKEEFRDVMCRRFFQPALNTCCCRNLQRRPVFYFYYTGSRTRIAVGYTITKLVTSRTGQRYLRTNHRCLDSTLKARYLKGNSQLRYRNNTFCPLNKFIYFLN